MEYKENLKTPNWSPLYVGVNWYGSNAVAFDYPPPGGSNRYYRVVLLP